MSNTQERVAFLEFLESGIAKGGFETDDVLAAILPLMKQVQGVHTAALVAPLRGVEYIWIEQGKMGFSTEKAHAPVKSHARVESLQMAESPAVEVVARSRRTADLDAGSLAESDLAVGERHEITEPVYLAGYESWEHQVGHHDELTDIFSLGMLLASVACGLDFRDPGDVEIFSVNRTNLFGVNRRLNPVVASVIVQMTELNRHRRAPDLGQLIARMENYRAQPTELDFERIQGFKQSNLTGKRRLIQAHLRDRLFEISRRNRLIYFKPTLQTLNLTVASVPILLDYRNIKLEQLFVWHPALAEEVVGGAPMSLGKYLRFEDAPYISGVLDKIISEARRDRAEYGFAQLRLVLCFLRWNNLKEAPGERIHSPLLLLPVELTRKKGVRDSYVLDPRSQEAEVNPALRHYLKELYNLDLPEAVDLKETTLDAFCDGLRMQIQASEPGVTLNKVDRPQIELIHEKARQRVDHYRRRMKLQARKARATARPEYSYERENFRPLGLQIFLEKVRPSPMPLREALGAVPQTRTPNIVENGETGATDKILETERQTFALREGENQNPYSWDFDLCNLTLGNFNYRKMTLVRDYAKLIETDMAGRAFDTVFSLSPRAPEEVPPAIELADQHLIISCDAAQSAAIARARSGASYIIQGPPGTGKSQTITNLIADYVALGKRILFVCEKRAAIDVVFHRLRQQGLDELCCLIHDSQTDKKAFIQDLRQTYERFLAEAEGDPEAERERAAAVRGMEQDLAALRRFSEVMKQNQPGIGIPVRSLLHRLVQLRGKARDLPPMLEEMLPGYPVWLEHGEVIGRLTSALSDLGEDLCFGKSPLRWLGNGVLKADRPVETLTRLLDHAEELLDAVESALELSGLPPELWDTFEEIQEILNFAVRARFLAQRQMLGVLASGGECADAAAAGRGVKRFEELASELDRIAAVLGEAEKHASGWKNPLTSEDTVAALGQAKQYEESIFRFLSPGFWRLKKMLEARYDFGQHAVRPKWSKILEDLASLHGARSAHARVTDEARKEWHVEDVGAFRGSIMDLKQDRRIAHASVRGLLGQLEKQNGEAANEMVETLAGIHDRFAELDETFQELLAEYDQFDFAELGAVIGKLREQTALFAELAPVLSELAEVPEDLARAVRRADLALNEFEGAMAHKSLNQVYRQDRTVTRFEGRVLARKMELLERHYREWLSLNGRCIRASVRRRFMEHVNLSALPASQVPAEQKAFKKSYATGRRDLEHEFGKTMRYKAIRELATGDTGRVVQDLKPIWLMSPLSVSDTLPLDPNLFDVVIFDEASQIPVEEAVPAIYRSHQVIVVGDEMQLPPTTFFSASHAGEETVVVEDEGAMVEMDLDSDSFLNQSARNLPSTMLAWHYRSRYESLISFSNAAFYSGNLFTIPDRQRAVENQGEIRVAGVEEGETNVGALLARSISFHSIENGVYEDRRNPKEAGYIAALLRGLLVRETKLSIGIVAFSVAQQGEIESALGRLAEEDEAFGAALETEYVREENDVFCGLFVKNLENVQGDERDIIIMSVCYAHDGRGRMLMNFGPINQRGGEKRLNVIFSRAKHHMAVVSSIHAKDITNEYNDGANSLKNFLHYAESVSRGDAGTARRVLENLNPLARKGLEPSQRGDAVVEAMAAALRARGHKVDLSVGQSRFRCDLAVRNGSEGMYDLGILVDTEGHYANGNLLDRYLMQPSILRAFGWRFALVLTKDWYHDAEGVLNRIEKLLRGQEIEEETPEPEEPEGGAEIPTPAVVTSTEEQRSPLEGQRAENRPGVGAARYFEFVGAGSSKFWEISASGSSFAVRFGRIGTMGQTQSKSFGDEAKAKKEADRLIVEKLKKGYRERSLA